MKKDLVNFVKTHGTTTAILQPVGQAGIRITLIGADGILGDKVVKDLSTARSIINQIDNLSEEKKWNRELVNKVKYLPGFVIRMAGNNSRKAKIFNP